MVEFNTYRMKSISFLGLVYIVEIDDYIADYAPALYAYLKSNELTDKSVKTDSGHYYTFPFLREDVSYLGTYIGLAIHSKFLDEAGLDVPKTIEDWDEMLYAFKDLCDIPLSGNSLARIRGLFANPYGFNGMNFYGNSKLNTHLQMILSMI